MRRVVWSFASLCALSTLTAVSAQSSHLSDLERATPAVTGDGVAAGAAGGWGAVWTVPAAAPALRGVLVGLEQNEFGSVATALAAARFKVGILWQLQLAQSQVSDVIDPELIAQFPELAALRVMARFVALDGVHTLGRTTISAGLRQEYDELLGVRASGVTARSAVLVRVGRRTALAGVVDRAWSSSLGTPADARAQIGVSHNAGTKAGHIQLNAGVRLGRLRESEVSENAYGLGVTISVRDIVSINASAGSGRLSQGPWTSRAAFGVGIQLGSLGANYRHSLRPEGRGSSRAMAITYTRRSAPPPDAHDVSMTRP